MMALLTEQIQSYPIGGYMRLQRTHSNSLCLFVIASGDDY